MFESLAYALDVTLPISIIILLGVLLKRMGWINENFAEVGAKLVFNLTLPCLLFINVSATHLSKDFPLLLFFIAGGVVVLSFIAFHFLALVIPNRNARGAFVQGACRGNLAIVGLALSVSAFGDHAVGLASMFLAVLVLPVNIFSILTLYYHQAQTPSFRTVGLNVLSNPLAIAIVLALLVTVMSISVPKLILDTGNYLARMTLPLALICVGASIRWHEFRASRLLYIAIGGKLVVLPIIATLLGFFFGFRGEQLGVLYIMMAAPTAAAAYPMVRSIGGDYHLAAAIIAGSTLLSMFTSTLGLFGLRYLGWV
ncbi:AEC family transporter [Paraglaciecola aquimarina]|uniref:AEC family transporter n=1 Tax=Paraglaciecola aquimarina TaxID=1235557 RepID=A0ABU3SX15_9ALTE|nr:AEC family transporter [Paraglaciecola aquimarina]MDU0354549.1 AEC family transporter [Paraglaciecola aquimarina]